MPQQWQQRPVVRRGWSPLQPSVQDSTAAAVLLMHDGIFVLRPAVQFASHGCPDIHIPNEVIDDGGGGVVWRHGVSDTHGARRDVSDQHHPVVVVEKHRHKQPSADAELNLVVPPTIVTDVVVAPPQGQKWRQYKHLADRSARQYGQIPVHYVVVQPRVSIERQQVWLSHGARHYHQLVHGYLGKSFVGVHVVLLSQLL